MRSNSSTDLDQMNQCAGVKTLLYLGHWSAKEGRIKAEQRFYVQQTGKDGSASLKG